LGGLFVNHQELFSPDNHYIVVEQPSFAFAGTEFSRKHFLPIEFKTSLEEVPPCPSILIFSSVLPYIPNPNLIIQQALRLSPALIIIDRTAVIQSGSQAWWIQDEPQYYGSPVSYPIQPLSERLLLEQFVGYQLIDQWSNPFDASNPLHKGFLLKRI
jgi:putative methyltransferase (TIGR04325 family)